MINCRNCGMEIFFSDDVISKNGRKIPLEGDNRPHNCSIYKSKKIEYGFPYNEQNGFTSVGNFIIPKNKYEEYIGLLGKKKKRIY